MADWVIERLGTDHDRSGFSCGKPQLDNFLAVLVSQYEKRGLGRTFVATEPDQKRVADYYTLAAGSLDASSLPAPLRKHLPKHPIPTIEQARTFYEKYGFLALENPLHLFVPMKTVGKMFQG